PPTRPSPDLRVGARRSRRPARAESRRGRRDARRARHGGPSVRHARRRSRGAPDRGVAAARGSPTGGRARHVRSAVRHRARCTPQDGEYPGNPQPGSPGPRGGPRLDAPRRFAARPPLAATAVPVGLPSATITREAAAAFAPRARARLRVDLDDEEQHGVNVIGIVPGTDPALAAEAVVVGAHYDHLGYQGGVMYPGADDNASGTALVVGLARAFASAGGAPRTLVFALFGGEELGLLGSGHYVRQPAIPLA